MSHNPHALCRRLIAAWIGLFACYGHFFGNLGIARVERTPALAERIWLTLLNG
jgi:hypothetical protein